MERGLAPAGTFTTAVSAVALWLRAVSGSETREITSAERAELLAQARAGGAVELELQAVTYLQSERPNLNFVRFRKGALKRIAKSFVGAPFLRDHDQWDIRSRAGTIVKSELVEHEGVPAFLQTVRLVKPWAVEGALDGTLDRFSIGWRLAPGADVLCTGCGGSMLWKPKGKNAKCTHWPGDVLEDGTQCQAEFQDATGVECSAVSVPAVEGTEIKDIRAALAASRHTPTKESMIMEKIAAALGLDDADEASILAELDRRNKAAEKAETLLAAEVEAHGATRAQLDEAQGATRASAEAARQRDIDALVKSALTDGKLVLKHDAEGKPTPSAGERAIRLLAATDVASARDYVAEMPRLTPVGRQLRSETPDPTPVEGVGQLTEAQESARKQLGLSVEAWHKHNGPPASRGGKKEE